MPRPSLKKARRIEILDAYGRCIASHGVEGATLEKIAEEAGLARALIRHNVGNKDELLDAFCDHFLAEVTASADELFDALPGKNRIEHMIEWLLDPQYTDVAQISVTNALVTAGMERPKLAKRLHEWNGNFIARVASELRREYPGADRDSTNAVATGIVAIYNTLDSMVTLGESTELRASSEDAARRLVSTLSS